MIENSPWLHQTTLHRGFLAFAMLCCISFAASAGTTAKTLYFLPPDDVEWFSGAPVMIINSVDTVKMTADPNRCGWFQASFINTEPPASAVFALDGDPANFQVGTAGSGSEPMVGFDIQKAFADFAAGGNTLFLVGDAGATGFSAMDPNESRTCSWDLATIIYDTDPALHGAFSCPQDDGGSSCSAAPTYLVGGKIPCIGVTKGIVNANLNPMTRKPVYNIASGCFENTDKFNQLFTETPNVNSKYCSDISFSRTSDGQWEFESDHTVTQSYAPVDDVVGTGSTKRKGYGRIALGTGQISAATYKAEGWGSINPATGVPYFDTYVAASGEFSSGTNPDLYNNAGWGECAAGVYPTVANPCRIAAMHNQKFCMESHADFVYRAGQTFSFRASDDLWVYINDKLVVDLGGNHLPAPGVVNLDDLGIIAGNSYGLDVFACNRRSDMSSLRIKSNMYMEQAKSLYMEKVGSTYFVKKSVCGGSSCDVIFSGGGCTVIDGESLNLSYALLNVKGDTIDGDPSTPTQESTLAYGVLYGGITVTKGSIALDTNAFVGLAPGRYQIVIRDATDPAAKTVIKFVVSDPDATALNASRQSNGKESFRNAVSMCKGLSRIEFINPKNKSETQCRSASGRLVP